MVRWVATGTGLNGNINVPVRVFYVELRDEQNQLWWGIDTNDLSRRVISLIFKLSKDLSEKHAHDIPQIGNFIA